MKILINDVFALIFKVFIQVKGRTGHLKKRQLKKNMSVGYAFGRGTKETFYVKGPKLGELANIIIEVNAIVN